MRKDRGHAAFQPCLLGFGAQARVVMPASLAREVSAEHGRAADNYKAARRIAMLKMDYRIANGISRIPASAQR